jgi:hypothetical protein
VANSITGDIDIRVKAQLADWTVSVATRTRFVWKRGATPAYDFYLDANTLGFYMGNAATATVVLPFEDNSTHWVRATRTAADGVVKFYTSDDGVDWTQLGADRATPAVALNDTTDQLRIAGDGALNSINGKLFYLEIRDGIDGSVAAKFDPAEADADASFVASTGETWTIVGGASLLRLPDATTGYEVIDENGVIADPYPLRRGRFDVAPITRDPGSGTVTIEARYEGPLARLLVPNVRHYTHEDQQLRLAGDKGFDQVEALQDTQDLWGPEVPVYPATTRSPRQPPELS